MSHNVHQRFSSVPSSNLMPPNPLPYFEQSSENSSPALGSQQFYDSAFAHLNHPELPRGSWRQPQQLPAPPEWLRVEEKLGGDYSSGVTVGEDSLRTSPSQPSFPPRQNGVHTHEVRLSFATLYPSHMHLRPLHSRSTSFRFCIRHHLPHTTYLWRVSSSHLTSRLLSFCNRSSKLPILRNVTRLSMLSVRAALR
jgi:hypothetical protein